MKKQEDIVFVCVSNDESTYQQCVVSSEFMTSHQIIKYDNINITNNIAIPIRYNSAISELIDNNYNGWIFFVHNDFTIMEDVLPIVNILNKEAIYGVIGAILIDNKRQIYGEIFQNYGNKLIAYGTRIDHPTKVETIDCQCIFFHSDIVKKYSIRFDENKTLSFHQYTEEFCLEAKDKFNLDTYAVQIKCKHMSLGKLDGSFNKAVEYINKKHNRRWVGTCLDKV